MPVAVPRFFVFCNFWPITTWHIFFPYKIYLVLQSSQWACSLQRPIVFYNCSLRLDYEQIYFPRQCFPMASWQAAAGSPAITQASISPRTDALVVTYFLDSWTAHIHSCAKTNFPLIISYIHKIYKQIFKYIQICSRYIQDIQDEYKIPSGSRPGRAGPGLACAWPWAWAGPAASWYFVFILYMSDISWIYLDILLVHFFLDFSVFSVTRFT